MTERINELELYIEEISKQGRIRSSDLLLKYKSINNRLCCIEKMGIPKRNRITSDSWVIQIENGSEINKFDNANHAAKVTGIEKSSIYKCLRGDIRSAGGYQWAVKPFENGIQRTNDQG